MENVDFRRADRTLILVVRKGCRFCDESMPFYKRIGDDATRAKRAQLVIVAPDEEAVSREELAKQQVRVDQDEEMDECRALVAAAADAMAAENKFEAAKMTPCYVSL